MTQRPFAIAVVASLALAAGSLVLASAPAYDAWAWLVWGRELAGLGLDTSSGPSFKPLPVAIAALLSPAGDAAPALWIVIVRASWLLSLALAGGLAYRLTAGLDRRLRQVAAGFAALVLLLLFDEITSWARQAAIGMSEPLLVALVLGAVVAALDDRSRMALVLAGLAALVRPEAWPLLAAYGVWRWRAEPALRPWIATIAVAVPVLWIAPDLLASHGAVGAGERALRSDDAPLEAIAEVLGRAATMPLAVVWPLAAFAAACAGRGSGGKREHGTGFPPDPPGAAVLVLALGALAWIAVVAVMAAAGFPGLPRFMAPAVAIAGVLAGVGLAQLLARGPSARVLAALAVAVVVITLAQLPGRIGDVADGLADSDAAAHRSDRLRDLASEIGRERLLRCGKLATSYVLLRTALAWQLGVPLSQVVSFGAPPGRSGAFVVGPGASLPVWLRLGTRGRLLGERGEWRVYSLGCSPMAEASSSRSAGVSGARR